MSNPKIKFIVTPPPDATVENSDASYTDTVASGGLLVLPDSQINVNSVDSGDVVSVKTIDVNITDGVDPVTPTSVGLVGNTLTIEVPSGASPSGVLLQFPTSSQYTSYRTGDEGWRVQNGWYNYTRPATPKSIAELDFTSANYWYLLKNNLVVGGVSNKTRFVDVDGGQTWSATGNKNLIVIDKLTGLGIYRPQDNSLLKANWNAAIDDGLSLSIVVNSITYSDWYLMSIQEFMLTMSINVKANNWVDPISSITILPTVSTGSLISYVTSTTAPATATSSVSPRFSNTAYVEISNFAKTSENGRPFYVFDARSLITAP